GRAPIDKLEQPQTFIVRNGDHRAEGSLNSLGEQTTSRLRSCRRFAKNPCECFAKTALRFEAAAISRFIHACAFLHLALRQAHPARAMISIKGHPIMSFELSLLRGRIDRQRVNLYIR